MHDPERDSDKFTQPEPDLTSFYVMHGLKIPDPFRHLENFRDSSGAIKPAIKQWIDAEHERTLRLLDQYADKQTLIDYFNETPLNAAFMPSDGSAIGPFLSMDRRIAGVRDQLLLVDGDEAEEARIIAQRKDLEKVILDVHKCSPYGHTSVSFRSAFFDPMGNRFLCKLYLSAMRKTVAYVIDATTGDFIEGPFFFESMEIKAWLPDASGFYFRDLRSKDRSLIRFHKIGESMDVASIVFSETSPSGSLDRLHFYEALPGNIVSAFVRSTHEEREVANWFVFDGRNPNQPYYLPAIRKNFNGRIVGRFQQDIYLTQANEKGLSDVFRMSFSSDSTAALTPLITNLKTYDLHDVILSGSRIAVIEPLDLAMTVRVFENGLEVFSYRPPISCGIAFSHCPRDDGAIEFIGQSYGIPQVAYHLDSILLQVTEIARVQGPAWTDEISSVVEFAKSEDGNKVPLTIVSRQGRDGGAGPTILYVYGGFRKFHRPVYSWTDMLWLAAGGKIAVAHPRGDGGWLDGWYEDGIGINKPNVFKDVIACAEHLIATGVTRTGRLACVGSSSGGLTAVATMQKRPDLFGCVVARVALLDVLNPTMGRDSSRVPEIFKNETGDLCKREDVDVVLSYSPLQNIKGNTCYPPCLLMVGGKDEVVSPANSLKFLAYCRQYCKNDDFHLHWQEDAGHALQSHAGDFEASINSLRFLLQLMK